MSLMDIVRSAQMPERTVELCLRGDLVARFESMERQLQEMAVARTDAFAGASPTSTLAEEMEKLREEMQASTVEFRLRAIGSLRSAQLVAEHAPRPNNDADAALGYNPEGLYSALIKACCYALARGDTVEQLEMSDEDWDKLFDALSNQQFEKLFTAAWLLDHDDVAVPTSLLAYSLSQRNGENSKQHGAGESAPVGSRAGSPSKRRSTSTTKKAASPAP